MDINNYAMELVDNCQSLYSFRVMSKGEANYKIMKSNNDIISHLTSHVIDLTQLG